MLGPVMSVRMPAVTPVCTASASVEACEARRLPPAGGACHRMSERFALPCVHANVAVLSYRYGEKIVMVYGV